MSELTILRKEEEEKSLLKQSNRTFTYGFNKSAEEETDSPAKDTKLASTTVKKSDKKNKLKEIEEEVEETEEDR